MQGRFRHILILIILLAGAHWAFAQGGVPDEVCVGTTRMYGVKGTPGAIYAWKVDGVLQSATADSIQVIWTVKGDHLVEVREFWKGCIGDIQSEQVKVTDQLTATVSITADKNNICPGTPVTFTAIASNGGPTPHYQWKVNGVKAGADAAEFTYTPADGDQVLVEMIPKAECVSGNMVLSNVVQITISEIVIALQKIVIDPVTQKGSIDITVSGGSGPGNYLYSWSNGKTTEDIANLSQGPYVVTVTDKLTNCMAQESFVVKQDNLVVSSEATPITCNNQTGTIKVTSPVPSQGLVYELKGITPVANTIVNATGTFDNLTPGKYGIIVRDTITGRASKEISQIIDDLSAPLPVPNLAVSVAPTCDNADGTIMVNNPRGPNLQYSIDNGAFQGSAIFTKQRGGKHTVRVRNVKTFCMSEDTITVLTTLPEITAKGIPAICYGANGFIEFTTKNVKAGNYTLHHDKGQFEVTIKADGTGKVAAPAGIYRNLNMEVNGCSSYNPDKPVNVEVTQPDEMVITAIVTPINLLTNEKASITLKVTGGSGNYTYSWDNGETSSDINNLGIGVYTVTVSDLNGCPPKSKPIKVLPPDPLPVAVNDTFTIDCQTFSGSVLMNDTISGKYSEMISTTIIQRPKYGNLILLPDGSFEYHPSPLFGGIDSFKYALFDNSEYPDITAMVYLTVIADFDHDGIPDDIDLDVDGDGIVNEREVMAGKDWHTEDTDKDGLPNYMDIDADGDGIVDNYEAQGSNAAYRPPVIYDANNNGLNDAYDGRQSGYEIIPIDTDGDGIPDFLDPDSDKDGVPDRIEGHDMDSNGKADHVKLGKDTDSDGLDDGYDTVVNDCDALDNMTGSNASMQDFDGDGIPDWRDDNDDNDDFLTYYEDMNGDGDFSNDDFDYDGYPEYLDYGRECDLFIPDAFSPNGDGVHDYYQIYCINHYPNAKIYIFDQLGNKLYEKANYGNEDIWGRDGAAWWDGTPDRGRNRGEKVAPGTYYYVLDLGNGEVKKSFVFVSY